MINTWWTRLGALAVLSGVLFAIFVGAGATLPDPALDTAYTEYIGEQVEIDGPVVDTDPVQIEYESVVLTVPNAAAVANEPIERGDHVVVYAHVEPEYTLAAIDIVVREPWEFHYVYAVSLLGGVWVLGRFLRQWRLNGHTLAFAPRRDASGN